MGGTAHLLEFAERQRAPRQGLGVHICDAEVDKETGRTTITRYTAIQDAGKAIHPDYVEGQMQGGAVTRHWLGAERRVSVQRGRRAWRTRGSWIIAFPLASDLPFIDAVIVEVPNPVAPLWGEGRSERCRLCRPCQAIAEAVYQSTGVRFRDLPLNPPKICGGAGQIS